MLKDAIGAKQAKVYERKDRFYRKAKAEGLRSRAAFKLDELARGVVRPGHKVVDLGCWPGGWLQVASRIVGERGLVIGVDVAEPQPLGAPNVRVVRGDVRTADTLERVRAALGGFADVVLSDMAPKLSGIRDRDEAAAEELWRTALDVARRLLRPGGALVCKLFMSPAYTGFVEDLRRSFAAVSATRPPATRKGSSEIYAVARDFRPAGGVSP